jgi:NTE family protein
MRVGLVLGAGGVLGGAWHTGALAAIARETEWDPGSADYIVGTSAGSVIGSLVAAGVPPWFMVAHSAGESFDGLVGSDGRPASEADRAGGGSFRLHRGLPAIGPGSIRMGMATLARPLRHTPLQMLAGWAPMGIVSTDSIKDTVRRAVATRWVEHPNYWAVATDYRSGKRTPFGRIDTPPAEIADAVAASCAIPGFFRPVQINGRPYVDGGVCSVSNLDLLAGRGLDVVICLNPLSSRHRTASLNPIVRVGQITRSASGRRLGYEAKKVRAYGTEVALIQPTAEDLEVMGGNMMSGKRRHEVIEKAMETVSEQLHSDPELSGLLKGLPEGEPHKIRRPDGHPSTWPELVPAAGAEPRRAA